MAVILTVLVRPVTDSHNHSNHALISTLNGRDIVESTVRTRACLHTIYALECVFSTRQGVIIGFKGLLVRSSSFNRNLGFISIV